MDIFLFVMYAALVVLVASSVSRSFRLPVVVGSIIVGGILGYFVEGIFSFQARSLFFEVSLGLLLFTIGLDFFNEWIAVSQRKRTFLSSFFQFVLVFVILFPLFLIFKIPIASALFLAMIFSFSSAVLIIEYLAGRRTPLQGVTLSSFFVVQSLLVLPLFLLLPVIFPQSGVGEGIRDYFYAFLGLSMSTVFLGVVGKYGLAFLQEKVVSFGGREVVVVGSIFIAAALFSIYQFFGVPLFITAFIVGVVLSFVFPATVSFVPSRTLRTYLLPLCMVGLLSLIDYAILPALMPLVICFVILILLVKFFAYFLIARSTSHLLFPSILMTIGMTSVGEISIAFSYIAKMGLSSNYYQIALMVPIVIFLIYPFIEKYIPKLFASIVRRGLIGAKGRAELEAYLVAESYNTLEKHVILCGNRGTYALRTLLDRARVSYLVIDENIDVYRQLSSEHKHVILGEASDPSVLFAAGIAKARVLVVAGGDVSNTQKIIKYALSTNPKIHILCSTQEVEDRYTLLNLGANTIVIPEFEGEVRLGYGVLNLYNFTQGEILSMVKKLRREHFID